MAAFATEPPLSSRTAPFSCAALAPPCENAASAKPPQRTTPRAVAKPKCRLMIHPLRKTIHINDSSGELRFHLKKITAAPGKIARCTPAVEHVYRLRLRLVNPLIEQSFESRLAPFECAFLADRHSSVIIAAKKKQKLFEW